MRAARNSKGRWCWPEEIKWGGDTPVRTGRVLHELGIPDAATQMQADEAAARMERRERMERRLGRP